MTHHDAAIEMLRKAIEQEHPFVLAIAHVKGGEVIGTATISDCPPEHAARLISAVRENFEEE